VTRVVRRTERKYVIRRVIALALGVGFVGVVIAVLAGAGDDPAPQAPVEAPVVSVTIPEGLTRAQVAEVVGGEVRGSYLKASESIKGFKPQRYDAPGDLQSLEGFLFPATYELPKNPKAEELVSRQLEKNLSRYDVLIIASMIEREVMVPKERKLVAAVIYNRLSAGEPLGIDATIRYGLEKYDEPLLQSELDDASNPYNTRLIAGLPPTPIGNPGLASIEAAARPAKVDYRYYVVKPYTCGEHVFTASAVEFDQAQAEYQAALEAEGGAPTPEDCG
jgi:UPF0755 protein